MSKFIKINTPFFMRINILKIKNVWVPYFYNIYALWILDIGYFIDRYYNLQI